MCVCVCTCMKVYCTSLSRSNYKNRLDYMGLMILRKLLSIINYKVLSLRLASTRARTRLVRVVEANYVISAFFPRQMRKSVRIIVPWDITTNLFVLTAYIPGSVLGFNPEGIKTVSGIFQEYAERLLNECGFTKFGFRVLSAP